MEYQETIDGCIATITVIRLVVPSSNNKEYVEIDLWVSYYSFDPVGGFYGESVKDAEGKTATFESPEDARDAARVAIKKVVASKRR